MSKHLGQNDAKLSHTVAKEHVARTECGKQADRTRLRILCVSMAMAFLMYLDRVCLSEIVKSPSFLSGVTADKEQIGKAMGAFFFSYAVMQIPAGWASDRFGARRMITLYILLWSLTTGLTALVTSVTGLLWARLAFGVSQAGAYPASGGLIRRWFPIHSRGKASGWISFGGRMGGTLAPFLTAYLLGQFPNWRIVLAVYALLGGVVALAYWQLVQDHPPSKDAPDAQAPAWNNTTASTHSPESEQTRSAVEFMAFPRFLMACATHKPLLCNSAAQFMINIGWVFLITWLPTYLQDAHHLPSTTGAALVSAVIACGMLGQIAGGWAVDRAVQSFGLRWGRSLPAAVACGLAALAYFLCSQLHALPGIFICCAMVSFFSDVTNPSTWSFMQDIGGKNTASVAGWGNMWGNLGASYSSVMVPYALKLGGSRETGQTIVFLVFSAAFLTAGLCFLAMNATHKLNVSQRTIQE